MPANQPNWLISAAAETIRSIARFSMLFLRGRIHQPTRDQGGQIMFCNGTCARVFRETVVDREHAQNPAVLVVEFRLRAVHGRAHAAVRRLSTATTPLFAGLPGFLSKLWLTNDQDDVYRGIYEWDTAGHAESYARALRRLLAPVSAPDSVAYHVIPDETRDRFLAESECLTSTAPQVLTAWWRPA